MVWLRCATLGVLAVILVGASSQIGRSEEALVSSQNRLWQEVTRQPTNYDLTYDLVRVSYGIRLISSAWLAWATSGSLSRG